MNVTHFYIILLSGRIETGEYCGRLGFCSLTFLNVTEYRVFVVILKQLDEYRGKNISDTSIM